MQGKAPYPARSQELRVMLQLQEKVLEDSGLFLPCGSQMEAMVPFFRLTAPSKEQVRRL